MSEDSPKPDTPDSNLSPRERRRQEFQATKPKVSVNPAGLKQWAWPIALLLLVGGIVGLMAANNASSGDCPGHWHSAYTVYVDGDRVPFSIDARTGGNPEWNQAGSNLDAPGTHIHGDDGVYHWHPAIEKCNPYEEGLDFLGVDVAGKTLELDENHRGFAGTHDNVRLFQQKWSAQDDEWREVTKFSSVLGKQPKNGDGLVIIAGDYTEEDIEGLLAAASTMKGNPSYDPHFEAS